ncbi:hypothetical protein L1887_34351 [Cichorium endivia]|nr:hypothetical protein L1887_34351 [Cichorium endivia]
MPVSWGNKSDRMSWGRICVCRFIPGCGSQSGVVGKKSSRQILREGLGECESEKEMKWVGDEEDEREKPGDKVMKGGGDFRSVVADGWKPETVDSKLAGVGLVLCDR